MCASSAGSGGGAAGGATDGTASDTAGGATAGAASDTAGGAAGGAAAVAAGGTALGGGANVAVLPGAGNTSSEEVEQECSEYLEEELLGVRSEVCSVPFECPAHRPAKAAAHAKPAGRITGTATAATLAEPREAGGLGLGVGCDGWISWVGER